MKQNISIFFLKKNLLDKWLKYMTLIYNNI